MKVLGWIVAGLALGALLIIGIVLFGELLNSIGSGL